MIIMEIGINIRNVRKQKGMSQEELSIKSQLSRSYVYYLESGKCSPTFDTLERIAEAMAISIWELIRGEIYEEESSHYRGNATSI